MIETSGRDVAMFHYVNKFFPSSEYNKLALHFVINDITFAEQSVDTRMKQEIQQGMDAISPNVDIRKVVYANAGGPYGSNVLKGVQADSDRVWDDIIENKTDVGSDWFKASFQISGSNKEQWTACAIKSDGSQGEIFKFP